jgi:glycosyltransferase involved in cell wall biosynthesis
MRRVFPKLYRLRLAMALLQRIEVNAIGERYNAKDGLSIRMTPNTEKVRVLWLIKGLGLGGAERLLVAALPHLNREEFEYQVGYFLPWKDALVPSLEAAGLRVTCFDARWPISLGAVNRVYRHVRENDIDVVHTHLPWSGIVGRVAGRLAGVPALLYTEHGCWNRLNRITRAMNRWTLDWNDLSIAVSDEVRASMGNVNGHAMRTIDNGIDCESLARTACERDAVCAEFGISSSHNLVIQVANLSPVKRHEVMLAAFARFAHEVPDSRLLLVGQLRDRKPLLEKLATNLGIRDKVIITGPRTDVPRLVKAADIFAMSSESEGLPISLLEAMGLGKPVVCTAVGGIPKVVREGVDGLLVPSENSAALADALSKLAANPTLRQQMGDSGAQRVRDSYDISVMVRQVENEYRRILESKRGQGLAHRDRIRREKVSCVD